MKRFTKMKRRKAQAMLPESKTRPKAPKKGAKCSFCSQDRSAESRFEWRRSRDMATDIANRCGDVL